MYLWIDLCFILIDIVLILKECLVVCGVGENVKVVC